MPEVQFEEEQSYKSPFRQAPQPPLVSFIMKLGLAKDATQANYILIGVMAVAFITTFFVIKSAFFSSPSQNITLPQNAIPGAVPGAGRGL